MNVRTLRTSSKRQELVDLSSIYGISIIGIFYHKRVHDKEIKLEKLGEYTIITTSAWMNSNSASYGGIGILINNDALISLNWCDNID